MRKRVVITEEVDGVECELTHEPIEWVDILKARVGDKLVVAYCVQDDCYEDIDDLMGDCMGKMHSFHRDSRDVNEGLAALGNTRDGEKNLDAVWDKHWEAAVDRYVEAVIRIMGVEDLVTDLSDNEKDVIDEATARKHLNEDARGASNWDCVIYEDIMRGVLSEMWDEPSYFPGDRDAQLLACYEHGGQVWSLSGCGTQCRWDTSNNAGVWIPDEYLRKQLDSDEAKGLDRSKQARLYASQFLNTYNCIVNGDVYGCVVEWFDKDGTQIDDETCWGFIGQDHAEEALNSEFYQPTCARFAAQLQEAV